MPGSEMPSTMWTVIGKAARGDAGEFNLLARKYRPPILAFIRNAVRSDDLAEDITQEVFVTLVRDDVLGAVDRANGNFRSLILSIARHCISARRRTDGALKRGGDRQPLTLDDALVPAAPVQDDAFDALWVENIVRLGMSRLQQESGAESNRYFETLFMHVNDGKGYADIAAKLGMPVTDVKNHLHQARLRLRRFVLQEIQDCSRSRTDYESEVAYLMKFIA